MSKSSRFLKARDKYVGSRYETNRCGIVEVIDYIDSKNLLVRFEDGYTKYVRAGDLLNGEVRNINSPIVCGVGYEGVGEYSLSGDFARKWKSMISRCYSENYLKNKPTYRGCAVEKTWHNFQNFAKWCDESSSYRKDFELDKDLLVVDNRCYSDESCLFLPREINVAIAITKSAKISTLPVGVTLSSGNFFKGQCCVGGKQIYSKFKTPNEAFEWYKKVKEGNIKNLADSWKDKLDIKAYNALINFEIGIYGRVR